MQIRPETPADFAAVATLQLRAFGDLPTAMIVALQRQHTAYEPALSLVAEENGELVGHALFVPRSVRLLGADLPAVSLGPIGVAPGHQRRGVGGAMIAAGHAAARERGALFSFLLGHTSYYPRHGYQTGAFGAATLVAVAADGAEQLESRPPGEADLPALEAIWHREENAVDMALFPGRDLIDWLSPHPAIQARVWLRPGADGPVGFTRVATDEPAKPRFFMAADDEAARAIVAALASAARAPALALPLHPASASAPALGTATATAWAAAMICPLAPGPHERYLAELRAGARAPGRLIWPVSFDV